MMKFTIACVAVAAFAAPAFAGQPDGSLVWNPNTNSQSTVGGESASAIIQNGQFVSGNCEPVCAIADQTTSPGSRANLVQEQKTNGFDKKQ
jgi:hypothetical protein